MDFNNIESREYVDKIKKKERGKLWQKDYAGLAANILMLVGGAENISFVNIVWHVCVLMSKIEVWSEMKN